MRICYLANASKIHTQRWTKYFAEKGHEVHIISFEQTDVELNGINIHVVKTNKNYLYITFLYKALQVKRIINDIKPDIIHAHYVTKYGIIGALTGFHPFVVSALGSDVLIHPKDSLILKKAAEFAMKRADLITCDGENSKDAIINLGTNSKKIHIIFHGVDTKIFKPSKKDEKLRKELELFDFPTIISVRYLGPIYDIESIIISATLILKEIHNVKFIIAGEGEQKSYLMNLAQSLDIISSFRFVGLIQHNELSRYLASADIYVSTSLTDGGLAMSTAEAMACGLPVVTTDIGDNRKWIEDGINGFIVPPKNPKLLADKIIYLIKNPDFQKRFGMQNRKIIEERNNYYNEMKNMEKLYETLIERHAI